MQTHRSPFREPYQHLHNPSRSADPFNLPTIHTEHCPPAAAAAFEHCAGRAMQSLSLPPPTSLPSSPYGRHQELGSGLVNFTPQFSPGRPERHSYPSPPMSDSLSPSRRPAHVVEAEGHPYQPRLHEPRPHPPPSSLLDPRSANIPHGIAQQRPLYPGESQVRAPPMHYHPAGALDSPYGPVHVAQNYVYGYPPSNVSQYLGSQGGPGPQVQQGAIITPQPLRQAKPARRTKAHVASACVNCKKAHLSCDVQRPCGRCVASGKQVSDFRVSYHAQYAFMGTIISNMALGYLQGCPAQEARPTKAKGRQRVWQERGSSHGTRATCRIVISARARHIGPAVSVHNDASSGRAVSRSGVHARRRNLETSSATRRHNHYAPTSCR